MDQIAMINDKRLDNVEQDVRKHEVNIQDLTSLVGTLTSDVQKTLAMQAEMIGLMREQAVQENEIKQIRDTAEIALKRQDENRAEISTIKTQIAVLTAVDETRITMAQAFIRYWPLWAGIGVASLAIGAFFEHASKVILG